MNRKILILSLLILVFAFSTYAVDMKFLNIAIIWNDQTYSNSAPYGWQVGSTSEGQMTHAPEIGKAQLKRVLNAIDPTITIDTVNSSLDTVGIPDELRDDGGIPFGEHIGKLRNVRIYKANSSLAYSMIKNDFDEKYITTIIYVNGGMVSSYPNVHNVLRSAAEDDLGTVLIGSDAAYETSFIDTAGTLLPITGSQREFRFKLFTDDIITEFDFDASNNSEEHDIPDTVKLLGDYDSTYYMVKMSGGSLTTDTLYKNENGVITNNTIYPNENILVKYGEWSIKAKAVSIIPNDLYAPSMTTGIFNNHDLILVSDNSGKITVPSFANWGAKLWTNQEYFDLGDEVTGLQGEYNSSEKYFNLTKDFIKVSPNSSNPNIIDSIFILRKGTKISVATDIMQLKHGFSDTSTAKNYMNTYLAGGYKELRIDLQNLDKKVFENAFPQLHAAGVSNLKFKPWSIGGRISCDADIWAFNEKFELGSFDSLYDGSGQFNEDVYYVSYLGNQVAISPQQFIKPQSNLGDFDKALSEMSIDSLGFDGEQSYGYKIYHAIALLQKGYYRNVLLGFHPSYLEDASLTQKLLMDAIKWVSITDNNHDLPRPKIIPKDSSTVKLDFDTLTVIMDFFQKTSFTKMADYNLITDIYINGVRYVDTSIAQLGDSLKEIDTFSILLSSIGVDKSEFKKGDIINITISAEPSVDTVDVHGQKRSVVLFLSDNVSNENMDKNSITLKNDLNINFGTKKYQINMNDIGANEKIEIQLFNLAGKKIKTLYNGTRANIVNDVSLKDDISKGIYLLVLKTKALKKSIKVAY